MNGYYSEADYDVDRNGEVQSAQGLHEHSRAMVSANIVQVPVFWLNPPQTGVYRCVCLLKTSVHQVIV